MVDLGDLGNVISETIHSYSKEVKEAIDDSVLKTAEEVRDMVKEKAPVQKGKKGKYKNSISIKREKEILGNKQSIVYVKSPHYRLTHLLEKGHVIRNQYGTYDRTRAFPHWAPAEDYANKAHTKRVIKAIETGGKG